MCNLTYIYGIVESIINNFAYNSTSCHRKAVNWIWYPSSFKLSFLNYIVNTYTFWYIFTLMRPNFIDPAFVICNVISPFWYRAVNQKATLEDYARHHKSSRLKSLSQLNEGREGNFFLVDDVQNSERPINWRRSKDGVPTRRDKQASKGVTRLH